MHPTSVGAVKAVARLARNRWRSLFRSRLSLNHRPNSSVPAGPFRRMLKLRRSPTRSINPRAFRVETSPPSGIAHRCQSNSHRVAQQHIKRHPVPRERPASIRASSYHSRHVGRTRSGRRRTVRSRVPTAGVPAQCHASLQRCYPPIRVRWQVPRPWAGMPACSGRRAVKFRMQSTLPTWQRPASSRCRETTWNRITNRRRNLNAVRPVAHQDGWKCSPFPSAGSMSYIPDRQRACCP